MGQTFANNFTVTSFTVTDNDPKLPPVIENLTKNEGTPSIDLAPVTGNGPSLCPVFVPLENDNGLLFHKSTPVEVTRAMDRVLVFVIVPKPMLASLLS